MKNHWRTYGRNYYSRYDYEGVATTAANAVVSLLRSTVGSLVGKTYSLYGGPKTVVSGDEFSYLDPVDHSVSRNQGIRVLFSDGSRIIFRLSGTAGSGATIRLYLERYEADPALLALPTAEAVKDLVDVALQISDITKLTGFQGPTVIT